MEYDKREICARYQSEDLGILCNARMSVRLCGRMKHEHHAR